jgi:hypothetical protein
MSIISDDFHVAETFHPMNYSENIFEAMSICAHLLMVDTPTGIVHLIVISLP